MECIEIIIYITDYTYHKGSLIICVVMLRYDDSPRVVTINTTDMLMGHHLPSKDQVGLGIIDIHLLNKAFLSKWIISLLNGEGTWQRLIRNKSLSQAETKQGDSHFWRGLMKIKMRSYLMVLFR